MLVNRILEAQAGSHEAILHLIKQFNPLLKKYARKLCYDDAYNDLLVEFLSLMKQLNIDKLHNHSDGGIVLYVSKSVYSIYVHQSKAIYKYIQKVRPISTLSEEEQYYVEVLLSSLDDYDMLYTLNLEKILNHHELLIIYFIFF